MFTGIIEQLGEITGLEKEGTNLHMRVRADFTPELKIDQSVAHNGACMTVVAIEGDEYTVTVIKESLDKTNLSDLKLQDVVNLERCMMMNARLDGHIVQGHVDQVATCIGVTEEGGSWKYEFEYDESKTEFVTVAKGSICINGVSLTVVDSSKGYFSVHIIPYTREHTNFHNIQIGDKVNLEFDIIGKYVARMTQNLRD
jgi:riboflavin synthase